jgi:hypothetical protein
LGAASRLGKRHNYFWGLSLVNPRAPRVEVLKNFASFAECKALNDFITVGIETKWLDKGSSRGDREYSKRLTNRMYGGRGPNPDTAIQIQHRICQHWGLQDANTATTAGGNGGVVVSTTFKGGDVHQHIDPRCGAPLSTLRCNLLSSAADLGCDLYVGDKKIDFDEGDLVCYLVTDWPHYVTENFGDKPRNLWMFGWYVPFDSWESGQIGVQH